MSAKSRTPDRTPLIEQLPSPLREVISRLEAEHSTQVTLRELLPGGKSGAFVALVDCTGNVDGVFVLKASPNSPYTPNEEERHREALRLRAFSGKIPRLEASGRTQDAYCLLVQIAGGSRLTWRPLVASQRLLRSAYSELARALWTPGLISIGDQVGAFSLLPRLLGHRLSSLSGGRIPERIDSLHPDLRTGTFFVHLEHRLPNPYFVAANPEAIQTTAIRPLLGPFHGDLHAGNLFVLPDMQAKVEDVCLIDFASFEPVAPFFYDHAYFELSTLLRMFDGLAPQRWLDLCLALLPGDKASLDSLDPSERAWAKDLYDARVVALSAAHEMYPHRADDLHVQHLLAQTAAGLGFLNKQHRVGSGSTGLSADQYQQALIWAAVALSAFLRSSSIKLPAEPTSIPTVGPQWLIAEQIDDLDWQAASGYDQRGLNILVLAPDVRTTDADSLATLFRVHWNLVLDFSAEPLPDPSVVLTPRPIRSSWPGGETPSLGLLERGQSWFFVNGRSDISGCQPAPDFPKWRRMYRRWLENLLVLAAHALAPPSVRVLCFGRRFDPDQLRTVAELLDIAFADTLSPMLIGTDIPTPPLEPGKTVLAKRHAVISRFATSTSSLPPDLTAARARVPRRLQTGQILLERVPEDLALRVTRDFTIVHRGLSDSLPPDRVFGVDFRRGMSIEWAELAANIDIPRGAFPKHHGDLRKLLSTSTNATYNLFHQPSAGGSTLSRRLAWSLMEDFPTVLVVQLTSDTAAYLRDLFQFTSLPLLILLESTVVTESAREALLQQLREDNTRGVFLWVSRVYRDSPPEKVLGSALSDGEAGDFLRAYQDQVSDSGLRDELARLVHSPDYPDQRSPFFFGLIAFGERYVGIDRLLSETLEPLTDAGKALLADLCLVTAYTGEAFPSADFDELCRIFNDSQRPVLPTSLFAYEQAGHLRIAHSLLARHALMRLARTSTEWQADLGRYSEQFLDHISRLPHAGSLRLRGLVEALFVTRDTPTVLEADSDTLTGGIPKQSRFAPLIEAMGNRTQARHILLTLTNRWPREPHFAVHLARHLLYEPPCEVDRAIEVMEVASHEPTADADDVVVHMLGMCYRVRMEQRLQDAAERKLAFDQVASAVRGDFELATSHFGRAIDLNPTGEHGRVASIQTLQRLITSLINVAGVMSLQDLLRTNKASPWWLDALSAAEEHVSLLRERPTLSVSIRAQKTIAQWDAVYGNFDAVIEQLRRLASKYEDVGIRRALYSTIVAKHRRRWRSVPQGDLRTIEELARRNVEVQGVRDADVRAWFMAFRYLRIFDYETAVRRLADWHDIRPEAIEPSFYLYVLRVVQWVNTERRNRGYADEAIRWLQVCRGQRRLGQRNWGYEWLTRSGDTYGSVHFTELEFDPVRAIRTGDEKSSRQLAVLGRVTGTLVQYGGPQRCTLDLGHGLSLHVTPLDRLVKDDLGRQVSAFISFGYEGLVGWDPRLVDSQVAAPVGKDTA